MKKRQQGMGIVSILLTITIIGFLIIYGTQIVTGYIDKNIIQKSVATTLVEIKHSDAGIDSVKKTIIKKTAINNIQLREDDISVKKNGSEFTVQIDYNKNIKINNDVSLLMNFSIEESTP